jgi:hypothetical protein
MRGACNRIDSMKPIRSDEMGFKRGDLILRSRAKHGVSKDARRHDLAYGRPSRRAQERAPQDEVSGGT